MNHLHVFGIFLRNIYLLKRSIARVFSLLVWVTVELFLWGFITIWLRNLVSEEGKFDFVLLILSALVFWNLFVRAQQAFTISFLEEVWTRNIINIFAAPITQKELVAGFVSLSVFQGILGFLYVSALALALYALHIWAIGFYLIPFFVLILIFGWVLGLITTGLIIRFGPSLEILAFFMPFVLLPFSAVYYPTSIFPEFVRNIAQFLPTMHLFEGMRLVLVQGIFPLERIAWASGLTIVYFVLGSLFFMWMIRVARKRGLLARLLTD